jgi:DUF1680 family protein
VRGEGELALRLRIPAGARPAQTLEVNGTQADMPLVPGTYVEVRRDWTTCDVVRLELPMPVRRTACHPSVAENAGRIALRRGPVLYCVETADNPGINPRNIALAESEDLTPEFRPDLLGGVVLLNGEAHVALPDDSWTDALYQTADTTPHQTRGVATTITAIPYYAWANREPGPMCVWLRSGMEQSRRALTRD